MKPGNTDRQSMAASQAVRRKNAILGALSSTVLRLTVVVALLWLRYGRDPASLSAKLFLIMIVLDLGSIPFIWISLRTRLKEIQGGEEDAAAQY
ncbi:MAG: hypothetical protein HDT15_07760 [Oscillibacter sp.]|nr:hypothetical protein [Oscillibacter sp.]MBD5154948.1 hypothetical protein [Oscillibacter sp.]